MTGPTCPYISPRQRAELLSDTTRLTFYNGLRKEWGREVAERYLAQQMAGPPRNIRAAGKRLTASKAIAIVLLLIGVQSIVGCASYIGDYGSGMTGEVTSNSGVTFDELAGVVGGVVRGVDSANSPDYARRDADQGNIPGNQEVHYVMSREECKALYDRLREEGHNLTSWEFWGAGMPGARKAGQCILKGPDTVDDRFVEKRYNNPNEY